MVRCQMLRGYGRIKKAAGIQAAQEVEKWQRSAHRQITGNCQNQDAPFGCRERQPLQIIKLSNPLHRRVGTQNFTLTTVFYQNGGPGSRINSISEPKCFVCLCLQIEGERSFWQIHGGCPWAP